MGFERKCSITRPTFSSVAKQVLPASEIKDFVALSGSRVEKVANNFHTFFQTPFGGRPGPTPPAPSSSPPPSHMFKNPSQNKWIQRPLEEVVEEGMGAYEPQDYKNMFRKLLGLGDNVDDRVELWQMNARFDLLYFVNDSLTLSAFIQKETIYRADGRGMPFVDTTDWMEFMLMCTFIKQTVSRSRRQRLGTQDREQIKEEYHRHLRHVYGKNYNQIIRASGHQ